MSRLRYLFIALVLICFPGCQHWQLQRNTLRQASTIAELHSQQVLNNLAMVASDPAALPYFSVAGTGMTNISRQGNAGATLGFGWVAGLFRVASVGSSFGAQQTNLEQWASAPTVNPDELELMRFAYQRTAGLPLDKQADSRLNLFFAHNPSLLTAMVPGWYRFGCKRDVPKEACIVGHYCDTYIWVLPGGEENLTQLTIAILDIATAVPVGTGGDFLQIQIKPLADNLKTMTDLYKNVSAMPNQSNAEELSKNINAVVGQLNEKLRLELDSVARLQAIANLPSKLESGQALNQIEVQQLLSLEGPQSAVSQAFSRHGISSENIDSVLTQEQVRQELIAAVTPAATAAARELAAREQLQSGGMARKNFYSPTPIPLYGPSIPTP